MSNNIDLIMINGGETKR